MASYRWNESAGRFINARGQFVSERAVRRVIDDVADAASARMAAASERLLAGEMSLGAWQAEMMATIKLSHVATATLAHGGAEAMNASRYGALGTPIREQYQFLRDFADQIADGRQPLNGSLTARARQYGQASRSHFERVKAQGQQDRGYRFVRSVLSAAEHCGLCVSEAARGWVPIGTNIPIGQRTCRQNDRCHLEFARTVEGEQAA